MKFLHKTYLYVYSFSKSQNSAIKVMWSPIAKCQSQKCYETQIYSYKGEIKTIILYFLFQKVKILMKLSCNWLMSGGCLQGNLW